MTNSNFKDENGLISEIFIINEGFETIVTDRTNRAFNYGCSLGLLPLGLIVISTFFMTRGNWIAAALIAILLSIALFGIASLIASFAKYNSIQRAYQSEILSKINLLLKEYNIVQEEFYEIVNKELPKGSVLNKYLRENKPSFSISNNN